MMISPEEFKNVVKDYSLDKLKQEKNRMEDYIKDYKNGKFNDSKEISCPSPDIICKVYKRYIEVLNILIAEKEKQTYQDTYIEINTFVKIEEFLDKHNNLDGARMTHVYKQNDYVEIEFDYLGLIYIFKIDGLKSFNYEWYEEDNYIDYINIFYDKDKNMYTFLLRRIILICNLHQLVSNIWI